MSLYTLSSLRHHHQPYYHPSLVVSLPLRLAFIASRFRLFRTAFVYTHSFFSVLLRPRVVNESNQTHQSRFPKPPSSFQVFSLARFTHGPQRYVVPEGPQSVRLIEFTFLSRYSGTRRHRLPQHRPDYILVPASDGVFNLPNCGRLLKSLVRRCFALANGCKICTSGYNCHAVVPILLC